MCQNRKKKKDLFTFLHFLLKISALLFLKLMKLPNCHNANPRVTELNAPMTTVTKLLKMFRNTHVVLKHYYVAVDLRGNGKSSRGNTNIK